MKNPVFGSIAWGFVLSVAAAGLAGQKPAATTGPVNLQVDNLVTPLGIDDPAPHFSWQLQDPARGAKQTAYEVQVATRAGAAAVRSGRCVDKRARRVGPIHQRSVCWTGTLAFRTLLLAREAVECGRQALSGERGELVGNRPDEPGCLARAVDRIRNAGRGHGATRAGGVDRESRREVAGVARQR